MGIRSTGLPSRHVRCPVRLRMLLPLSLSKPDMRENGGGHLARLRTSDSSAGIVRGGSVLYGMILEKGIQFRSPNHDATTMLHSPQVPSSDRFHMRASSER